MLTGVILNSASSTKENNQPIGLMDIGEEKLIHRQILEMKKICKEIILVVEEPRPYLSIVGSSIRIITDYYQGLAPLSSLHAALSLAKHPYLWVVGSNKLNLSSSAALAMLQYSQLHQQDLVLPALDDIDFFHSIYSQSCLPVVEELLKKGHGNIQDLLPYVQHHILEKSFFSNLGLEPHFTFQVKNPADFRKNEHSNATA